jgi:3-oxoadipate enol-lactonase
MPDSRIHSVSVDGAALRVFDDGEVGRTCVVLAHSIMTSANMWSPQVEYLVGRGYRVLRPESRGHGASASSHAQSTLTIDRLAADVVQVLDGLDVDRANFVGLSLGGMVGFALGQQHAGRIASLVICDARADSPPAFAQPWDERIVQARERGMASLVQPTLDRWFADRFAALDRPTQAQLREDISGTSIEGFIATARALQDFDYTAGLASMQPGATLIVGDKDGVLPEVMSGLAGRMPECRLEVIPNAGHLPNLEQPALFNAALAHALERQAAH